MALLEWSTVSRPPLRTSASSASSVLKGLVTLLAVSLAVTTASAQGPQEWLKRILDPATIGVTLPPGAVLNRKLTVDYLSKTDPPKKMAIYMMPFDQLKAASDYFKSTLKFDPAVSGSDQFEIQRFQDPGKGLTIVLARSQFVDNKLQITIEYVPK